MCAEKAIKTQEYGEIQIEETQKIKRENLAFEKPEVLGLYFDPSGKLCVSYFVGWVWLETEGSGKIPLRVTPKGGDGVELRMLEECLAVPEMVERMWGRKGVEKEQIFWIWPEQKPFEVEESEARSVFLFLIVRFLLQLKGLCEHHLRRRFPRIEANLSGTLRGRVLVSKNLLYNTVRGRHDRVYCQFQTHSLDTLENQILKAALEVSLSYLANRGFKSRHLWQMGAFCRNVLSSVTLRRIFPYEFQNLRLTGNLKPYREPIRLARIILHHLGGEPNPERWEKKIAIPPYAINMNALFERYCEAKLRKGKIEEIMLEKLWPGENNIGKDFKVRPDFLFVTINKEYGIADAKYKYDWPKRCKEDYREDVYQVAAYASHKYVREKLRKLGISENKEIKTIYIFYPKAENSQKKDIKDFEPFTIRALPVELPK